MPERSARPRWWESVEDNRIAWPYVGSVSSPQRLPPLQKPATRRRPSSQADRTHSWTALRSTLVQYLALVFVILTFFVHPSHAAFVKFDNCLDSATKTSNPRLLQWTPLWLRASFVKSASNYNLNITIYGNVSGGFNGLAPPPPSDPSWTDPNETAGKIIDISPANLHSTLNYEYNVLSYTPYVAPPSIFCESTVNSSCPIGPAFFANASDPYTLPAFSVAHLFSTSYAFTTITSTVTVISGNTDKATLACISANITPGLGATLSAVLRWIPALVLIFVAIATVSAAIFSPWGSTDPFKWSSNYGRDEDLLRLVTPGFGDCLQYIQFIVLSGSLSLNYPGFYQPIVSKMSWSTLMFNESFVSGGDGTSSLVDGIYVTHGRYGLTRMSQLVGMTAVKDIWACMVVWLLVVIGIVILVCQLGFIGRWIYKTLANTSEEDLRSKNWPFTAGNLVRIVCNFFLLPIVALSMFQMVVAGHSPGYLPALAVVLLVAIILFAGWILRIIFSAKPRAKLFDDLPTVLLYGPLYNTYADNAAPFALVPAFLTFIRGVAIGAVQDSGIAQLVMLAICEIILILTLNAFRPFHSPTSMNFYHTFFASVRLAAVMLSVAFLPELTISETPQGWIGYVILLLHAIVLIFAFFLNAVQTLIEVGARAAGAGGDEGTGAAARGGLSKVFGLRQLSKRAKRPGFRSSMTSDAAMLTHDDAKSAQFGTRSRSLSASSAILLNQRTPDSSHLDQMHPGGDDENGIQSERTFSFLPDLVGTRSHGRPDLTIRTQEPSDPYYRPPKQRRPTGDLSTPGARSRNSWMSGELVGRNFEEPLEDDNDEIQRGRSFSSPQAAPNAAYLRGRDDSDTSVIDRGRPNPDYATREVDFYYGVRGPALSNMPTRKLKTGPADPVGPVSSATGWFKNILGRKTKESGKGFEVVRSSRALPPGTMDATSPPQNFVEPYQDSPQSVIENTLPGQRTRSNEEDRELEEINDDRDSVSIPSPYLSEDEEAELDDSTYRPQRVSDIPPMLAPVDIGTGLGIQSRIGSRASRASHTGRHGNTPIIPRKSSRRHSVRESHDNSDRTISEAPSDQETYSSTQAHSRVPFSTLLSATTSRKSVGTESLRSSQGDHRSYHRDRPISSDATGLAPARVDVERPTSMGYVNHHRASDGLYTTGIGSEVPTGNTAEFVRGSPRRSREDEADDTMVGQAL